MDDASLLVAGPRDQLLLYSIISFNIILANTLRLLTFTESFAGRRGGVRQHKLLTVTGMESSPSVASGCRRLNSAAFHWPVSVDVHHQVIAMTTPNVWPVVVWWYYEDALSFPDRCSQLNHLCLLPAINSPISCLIRMFSCEISRITEEA
jgi:hypothetical protein